MASEKITKILDEVKAMTVLELNELVKAIEEEFGVSASAVAVAAPAGGAQGGAQEEEKSEYTVILKSAGAAKIKVIKAVQAITGLGLKDSKDLVDGAPKTLKENVEKAEADEIAAKIKEAGGEVELK
ncbi:50S ribosomal protein L7/L12 [Amygdalobacter indicium]|jgi:hypothetical protein|uniref:Large ribosomal subunit protein bL12 n=1 Tax=Amygdalobacter indicium TaxID=3029272 RepID=A0ABY8C4K6_9FIRM|nr:50S ribosomal protein L7/L12 [Amygdalobacter indicium]WEG33970.1 50S ribosomal protein L7/L12 [Amygdalobacter indicium]WEG35541.1 50S ribosomal protein L7/L12 [Amygdalobacter indicium]